MKNLMFAVMFLGFVACTKSDFSKIKKGMAQTEAISIVGKPVAEQDVFFAKWLIYDDYIIAIVNDTVVNCSSKTEIKEGFQKLKSTIDSVSTSLKTIDVE